MQYLTEALQSNPDFLNEVRFVNVKIDQTPLIIRKHNNDLTFWGRGGRKRIGFVKRTGMDMYEKPIQHIWKSNWQDLPNGLEIHTEIFDSRLPTAVQYGNALPGTLILSLVVQDGQIMSPEASAAVANTLNIMSQPVTWVGPVDVHKASVCYRWMAGQCTSSFRFEDLIDLLGPIPSVVETLRPSMHEGLVFATDTDMAKVVNPAFQASHRRSSDPYLDVLTHLMYTHMTPEAASCVIHLTLLGNPVMPFGYVTFAENMVKAYVQTYGELFDHLLRGLRPQKFSRINQNNVSQELIDICRQYRWAEDLFRLVLFEFNLPNRRFALQVKAHRKPLHQVITDMLGRYNLIEPTDISSWVSDVFPFKLDDVPRPASRPAALMVGRCQPFHSGHLRLLKGVECPVVALVTGKHLNKRSPFPFELRKEMINVVIPGAEVIPADDAYVPTICLEMRRRGLESTLVLAGDDRIHDYKRQISKLNWYLPPSKRFNTRFQVTERTGSGTDVRASLMGGTAEDRKAFRKMMPRNLWKYWDTLATRLRRHSGQHD